MLSYILCPSSVPFISGIYLVARNPRHPPEVKMKIESKEIKCPFYHAENGKVIYCDGVIADSSTATTFKNKNFFQDHKKNFCEQIHNYQNCPIANANLDRWSNCP